MIHITRKTVASLYRSSFWSALILFLTVPAFAQEIGPEMLSGMRWRSIGPHRAGRITSVSGVPNQTSVYYIATPGGGLWKTDDAGQVWKPVSDSVPYASIGAVAVAPSNPNIVYMGTGEQTQGNGVYKSTDAGATWKNIGLEKTHVITGLVVDPRNPDIVLVAAAGDFFSGAERGVFKTTDGGKSWQKVLFKDNDTAIMDLNMAPGNPKVLYAAALRRPLNPPTPPPAAGAPREQDATIYKSADEGTTWTPVGGKGLPTEPMGRVGVAAAPGPTGKQVFAIVAQGVFGSDDGGENWTRTTTDPRVIGSGYFSRIFVDPTNAKILYVAQTTMYRSGDGGKTFVAWNGAPSGDDIHTMWINPASPQNMILGVDQGASVSSNGGNTWSSWYNQPTGQFYHVSTDNQFPYHVYAAQQDSGTVAVASRSDVGQITYREWFSVGGMEFAYITPDPLNPNSIYTGGWYGSVLRFDKTTGQLTHVFVRTSKYRTSNSPPIVFSPQDPHILYVGAQFVMQSGDGGYSWQEISPDLTQKIETAATTPRSTASLGVISTMAASTVKVGQLWVGTSNGLVQMSKDGRTWQDVTPHGLPARSNIIAIEASRHDAAEAYCVVSVFRELKPFIYRTRDFGKSWQTITTGLPETAFARIVREDPVRKGLLYGGTENAVYASFDDGDHWKSLQLNLPTTSVRDLEVHGNDLVAATYGRSLWILDDVSPLRQIVAGVAQRETQLLEPSKTSRVRWDSYQDTPLPAETPAGKNPPEGAIIYYFLDSVPAGEIKLSVFDAENQLVREYSSTAPPIDTTPANAPEYWFAPQAALSKSKGINRFNWDLRYPAPKTLRYSYGGNRLNYIEYTLADHTIPGETPREQPQGPYAVPGDYTLVLSVGGKTYKQTLTVTLDPRVHVSQSDLAQQLATERDISAQMAATYEASEQGTTLRAAIADRLKSLAANSSAKDAVDAMKSLDEKVFAATDGSRTDLGLGPLNRELARLATMIESGDSRPATPLQASVGQSCQDTAKKLAQWRELNGQAIQPVNSLLQKYNVAVLPIASSIPADPVCSK